MSSWKTTGAGTSGKVSRRLDLMRILTLTHNEKLITTCTECYEMFKGQWGQAVVLLKTYIWQLSDKQLIMDVQCMDLQASIYCKRIDKVQTQALRICCGAFRTSPKAALQLEMGEMPLKERRKQLKMVYWVSLKGHNSKHPTKVSFEDMGEQI